MLAPCLIDDLHDPGRYISEMELELRNAFGDRVQDGILRNIMEYVNGRLGMRMQWQKDLYQFKWRYSVLCLIPCCMLNMLCLLAAIILYFQFFDSSRRQRVAVHILAFFVLVTACVCQGAAFLLLAQYRRRDIKKWLPLICVLCGLHFTLALLSAAELPAKILSVHILQAVTVVVGNLAAVQFRFQRRFENRRVYCLSCSDRVMCIV